MLLVWSIAGPITLAQSPSPGPTPEDEEAETAAIEGAESEDEFTLPLRKLIGPEEPIMLRNARSIYTLFVPIPARYEMDSCKLRLRYTNSISLLPERSQITILVNDRVVHQEALLPDKPNNILEIDIPTEILEPGFARLQFQVAQHYTLECEDPAAPELFTSIDPDNSMLIAEMVPRDITTRLSRLHDYIDEKLWNTYDFHVCLPGAATYEDQHLSWGNIVSQGVGLSLLVNPLQVSTSKELRPGVDNIIVGTLEELSVYLTASEISSINGSFIALKTLPGDKKHFALIITGRTEEEVSQAALAFAYINFPLPDSQFALVTDFQLAPKESFIRNAPLTNEGVYQFKDLGFDSHTIKGWNAGGFQLETYFPGDLTPNVPGNLELRLNFVYGANFRADSVLNVFVNNQFQQAVRLNDPSGGVHYDHRIYLPVRAFQPGRNTVDIYPVMVPSYTHDCEMIQEENLLFTLYDSSGFVLPSIPRGTILPNLGSFSQAVFPFSGEPDGSRMAMHIANRSPETITAGWTLMAKMAQISGALLYRSEISFTLPKIDRNLIVVGEVGSISEEVLQTSPVSPLDVGRMQYLVSVSQIPTRQEVNPVQEFLSKFGKTEDATENPLRTPATVKMGMNANLTESTVLLQFENPFAPGLAAMILTSPSDKSLLAGVNLLQDRRLWDRLKGDLAVWRESPETLAVAKVGGDFRYGSDSVAARVTTTFNREPWILAAVLIGCILLLSWIAMSLLKRRRRDKEEDQADD